jgi:MoxR-like ATPase
MAITEKQAEWFKKTFDGMVDNVELALLGKRRVIELVFAAMVSEGHVLLEDFPGTGKTALARAMSQTLKGTSSRIQFTPDLLPGDVTGITVYDQKKGVFEFHAGPIFANVVLADEINRASPKTQSALLEAMEEGKVTIDGVTRSTGVPFIVIATQNPIEQAGTYRLPEAQLDRFMIKTSIGYPDQTATLKILEGTSEVMSELSAIVSQEDLVKMSDMSRAVFVNPLVLTYISEIVEATREAKQIKMGSSVRGARSLTKLSKTWAAAHGRTFVTPDDVKALAEVVLAHRLVLDPEAEFDGVTTNAVIAKIMLDIVPPSGSDIE